MIAKHPKMLIGFSDITALHAAIGEKSGIVTIHGPMLSSFKDYNYTPFTLYNFENGLSGSLPKGEIRLPAGGKLKAMNKGMRRAFWREETCRSSLPSAAPL